MKVPLLDLQAQYRQVRQAVEPAVREVLESQRFVLGPVVERLEELLRERTGAAHAVACASGTDALLLPLRALDLAPGSGVIVPAFTFFATAGAVWNAGLRPLFCDVDPETFNITAGAVQAALTPEAAALIPVHLFGQMAELGPLRHIARARGLTIVEDAAQAIDAEQEIDGGPRPAGSLGDFGAFSFFPTKNLGGFGDGGLVTVRDGEQAEKIRKLRVHGGRQMYHHEMVGTNSRLDAIQAAVLVAKIPFLDQWTEARRRNAAYYDQAFAGLDGIRTPVVAAGNQHVYNQYTIRAERRDALRAYLDERGIGSGIYYPVPLHLQECFASLEYRKGDFPASERAATEVLSLPVYPELTEGQLSQVAEAVLSFYR